MNQTSSFRSAPRYAFVKVVKRSSVCWQAIAPGLSMDRLRRQARARRSRCHARHRKCLPSPRSCGLRILLAVEIGGFPKHAVRLILLARVAGYIEGHGRVRLETAEWVASLLSKPTPKMPLDTATGPGEVMPLSWLYPSLSDVDLATGEIMSLYNGSPCATGFVCDAALVARHRLRLLGTSLRTVNRGGLPHRLMPMTRPYNRLLPTPIIVTYSVD